MSDDYKIYVDPSRPATLNNGAGALTDCATLQEAVLTGQRLAPEQKIRAIVKVIGGPVSYITDRSRRDATALAHMILPAIREIGLRTTRRLVRLRSRRGGCIRHYLVIWNERVSPTSGNVRLVFAVRFTTRMVDR
jgi:hypothetical protein